MNPAFQGLSAEARHNWRLELDAIDWHVTCSSREADRSLKDMRTPSLRFLKTFQIAAKRGSFRTAAIFLRASCCCRDWQASVPCTAILLFRSPPTLRPMRSTRATRMSRSWSARVTGPMYRRRGCCRRLLCLPVRRSCCAIQVSARYHVRGSACGRAWRRHCAGVRAAVGVEVFGRLADEAVRYRALDRRKLLPCNKG
jgi:hypothetical protein